MSVTSKQEVRARIVELERQILDLRLELDGRAPELPAERFDYLELFVGEERYGVLASAVREVHPVMWCQRVPDAPEWVVGALQHDSDVAVVIDLECRLKGTRATVDPSLKIVLLDAVRLTGIVVTGIGSIVSVLPEQVVPPQAGSPQARFLMGDIPGPDGVPTRLLSVDTLGYDALPFGGGDE